MHINIERNLNSVTFSYSFDNESFYHTLHMPMDCTPLDDSLFRIALLSRPKNSANYQINGVTAESQSKLFFEKQYNCKIVIANGETTNEEKLNIIDTKNGINLSFSGGFDSVASLFVTGEQTSLFSHDFGGNFKREADFFFLFNGKIFKWELRGKRAGKTVAFNESIDWRFMLAPLLCYRKPNEPFIISTGTILEASPYWYSSEKRPDFKSYACGGFGPNIALINPVCAVSEYCTTYLTAEYLSKDLLAKSLSSLADIGSLKRYRKETLLAIVAENKIHDAAPNMPRHKFGNGFTDDILTLYLVWKLGYDWVKENYCSNIPPSSKYLDMSFFEKVNLRNLETFDPDTRNRILKKYHSRGLGVYDNNDYRRLTQSLELRADFLKGSKIIA